MVQTEVGDEWGYGPVQNKAKCLDKQSVMTSCYTQEFVRKVNVIESPSLCTVSTLITVNFSGRGQATRT